MKPHLIVLLVFIVCVSVNGERGSVAVKGQFPYYVSLQNKHKDREHFCSGVIINTYLILSSDWCSNILNAEHIEAHFGKVSAYESIKRVGIKKIMPYKPEPDKSVALFYTNEKIPFSEAIQPITLQPKNQWSIPHKRLVVLGWDHKPTPDSGSLKFKFTSLEKCHMQIREIYSCTWDDMTPSGSNPWPDTGSSIVDNTNPDKPYLVGLIIQNEHWSPDGNAFTFIRVSSFATWIEDNEKVINANDALWPLSHATSFAVTFVIIACFILPIAFTYMKYLSQRQKEANMSALQPPVASANPVPRVRVAHISRMIPPRIPAYPELSRSISDDSSTLGLPPSYDSLFPDDNKPRY